MSDYPEHEKLQAVVGQTDVIGEFLEWAQDQGVELMCVDDGYPYRVAEEPLLAQWAGIDLAKLKSEKRAMLDTLRSIDLDKLESERRAARDTLRSMQKKQDR